MLFIIFLGESSRYLDFDDWSSWKIWFWCPGILRGPRPPPWRPLIDSSGATIFRFYIGEAIWSLNSIWNARHSDMCIVCGPWPTFWPRIEDTWTIFWAHTEIMFYIPCNPNHAIKTYSVLFSFPKCVILEAPVRVHRYLELRLFLMQKYLTVSGSKKSGLWPFTSITRTTHNLHAKYNGSYALPKIRPFNINWFWNQNWPQMPGLLTSLFIQRAKRKISCMTTKLGGTASSPTTREEIALKHCW